MNLIPDESAYVILINEDNTMTVTQKRRIVQKSKLVDVLWFLVHPNYNGLNMANFTVLLEYLLPVSKKYKTEILTLDTERYNEYLRYVLPVDTMLTSEAGKVEIQLSFLSVDLDEDGKSIQRSRKVAGATITITPISVWSDIIPDCALTALDQRIIKMDAQIKALGETSVLMSESKADNIIYDEKTNEIQLSSGGDAIGDRISLKCVADKDGIPVVEFSTVGGGPNDKDDANDVVEF